MNRIISSMLVSLLAFAFAQVSKIELARAEETTGEQIHNMGREAKKDAKHAGRTTKRKLRNATGNHSTKEDIKDGVNNAADETETGAQKMKDKVD